MKVVQYYDNALIIGTTYNESIHHIILLATWLSVEGVSIGNVDVGQDHVIINRVSNEVVLNLYSVQ